MTVQVKVKTNSKEEKVEFVDDTYIISTKSPAKENKANIAVISLLSKYLDISKSKITIKRGLKSKNKIVEIDEY